ncbi:lipopolysaccharide kinase InaA family protein [Modicisalibacter radicis]|uniref:lipopolysaccharide kinase InaA family protein n=1 Tax=Halomonas sp. EAR18 TaxID=2518972 RepID=UPI00109C9A76|nr:lipopolysaccharide kinase InaA family protein [Halomonas sp. EAR18]
MPLHRVSLDGVPRWYLIRDLASLPTRASLSHPPAMATLERIGSSAFYLDETGGSLYKLVRDKYDWRQQSAKWLFRDLLDKRLSGRSAAAREYRSNRIIRRAGLRTIACRAYGVAVNPGNPLGSLYVMEYLDGARSGERHFLEQDEAGRRDFLRRMCDEALRLIAHGYVHRDFHFGNVLVDAQGELIWIDTHVRRLPRALARRQACLEAMLSPTKLQGETYRQLAHEHIRGALTTTKGYR